MSHFCDSNTGVTGHHPSKAINSNFHWTKMATILQMTVSDAFWWIKSFYFDLNFTEFCPQRFNWQKKKNWQKVSICLGNGLMPDKRQAITWTNGDPVQEIILLRIFYNMSGNNIGHPTPPPRPRSSKITKPHQLSLYVFSFDKVTEPHTHLKVHYFFLCCDFWCSISWDGVWWIGAKQVSVAFTWALSYYSDLTLSQSFQPMAAQFWKLRSHWLKFLRQCHVAVVRQDPGSHVYPGLWHHTASFGHNELSRI